LAVVTWFRAVTEQVPRGAQLPRGRRKRRSTRFYRRSVCLPPAHVCRKTSMSRSLGGVEHPEAREEQACHQATSRPSWQLPLIHHDQGQALPGEAPVSAHLYRSWFGQAALVDLVGDIERDPFGVHAERGGDEFGVDGVDQVGKAGAADRPR
jgi:hypothetical protein